MGRSGLKTWRPGGTAHGLISSAALRISLIIVQHYCRPGSFSGVFLRLTRARPVLPKLYPGKSSDESWMSSVVVPA